MTFLYGADTPATLPDHGLVPFRDLGRSDRECFFQFFKVRSERGFEEQGGIKGIPFTAIESYKNILPDGEPCKLLLVMEYFGPPATLVAPVKEPPLRHPVMNFQFGGMVKQCPIAGKKLRVAPAPFIHEFPESPVRNCLTYPGDLSKSDMEVMEREETFAVGSRSEFLGSV
jgi:hypothetical protein